MYLFVRKTPSLTGQATVPSSKSQSIRALIFATLAKGESTIINPLDSLDMQDAIKACKQLGADIRIVEEGIRVNSQGIPFQKIENAIYTGNSGITTHFILPLLGLRLHHEQPIIVDCGEQMRARPINPLVEALRNLGLHIQYLNQEGKLPVAISGALKGGMASVDGITSQYVSALLIALPCALSNSEIWVKHLHERPYMQMTLDWLTFKNIHFTHHQFNDTDVFRTFCLQTYAPFYTTMKGDFSAASYVIAAAVMIPGQLELKGLDMQDSQGDKRLISILKEMGADIRISSTGALLIQGGRALTGIKIDANDIPDLLPTLAVIGTYAKGKTEITHVEQARIKETDRIHSMTQGLTKLGAKVEEYTDGMTVYQSELKGDTVQGFDDHRTVMALSLAGMLASGTTRIAGAEAINKTFPTFITLMQSLGAKMELDHATSD